MPSLIVTLFIGGLLVISKCRGDVSVQPTELRISSGFNATFICCTTLPGETITWRYTKPLSNYQTNIYPRDDSEPRCSSRFSCTKIPAHCVSLFIGNAHLSDSGTYTCIDYDEMGAEIIAQLTVFESECRNDVGNSETVSSSMNPVVKSSFRASCVFNYTGLLPLSGKWSYANESSVIVPVLENSSTFEQKTGEINQINFFIEMKSDLAIYGGKLVFEMENSNFTWTSPAFYSPLELNTLENIRAVSSSRVMLTIVIPIIVIIVLAIIAVIIILIIVRKRRANIDAAAVQARNHAELQPLA